MVTACWLVPLPTSSYTTPSLLPSLLLAHCIYQIHLNTMNTANLAQSIRYVYRLPSQFRWECAEPAVLGRKQSLSKVGLQRWIFYRMRVSYLSDIELRTQAPARGKLQGARQYYVQFSVGDTSRSTISVKEAKNRASWDETFYLWAHVLSLSPEN